MSKAKLKPNNGGKKMSLATGGTNKPMAGSGARGTSKGKLKPNNGGSKMSISGGGSNRPMNGSKN